MKELLFIAIGVIINDHLDKQEKNGINLAMKQPDLTQYQLKCMFWYNPANGAWLYKRHRFRLKVGTEVKLTKNSNVYGISIDGKHYKDLNLAWLYMTGKWPEKKLVLKDKDKGRGFDNIIEVDNSYILHQKVHKNRTSIYKNVCYNVRTNKWIAYVTKNGKNYSKEFAIDKEEEAAKYAKELSEKLYGK